MAHYAFLDENNVVVDVIVGRDEADLPDGVTSWEDYYGEVRGLVCVRTSYNTSGGVHVTGGVPFRKNYAGIGFSYDSELDGFIPPKPFDSWVLDEETCLWVSPVPMPDGDAIYGWDEDSSAWLELPRA